MKRLLSNADVEHFLCIFHSLLASFDSHINTKPIESSKSYRLFGTIAFISLCGGQIPCMKV